MKVVRLSRSLRFPAQANCRRPEGSVLFGNFLEFSPQPRSAQGCQTVIRYGGGERDVGVATSFRGQVQCWGLVTCVLVAALFASRSRRPTGGRGSAAQNSSAVRDRREVCH